MNKQIKYHKIQTIFKRDPETNFKSLLFGEYSLPEFEYLSNNKWVFTEKIDGTNIRIWIENDNLMIGGRNDNSQIPVNLVNKINNRFNVKELKYYLSDNFILFGEGFGGNIQKAGKYYRNDVDFILFDISIKNKFIPRESVILIAEELKIEVVPIVGEGTLNDMIKIVENGFDSYIGKGMIAEGIVARPKIELNDRVGNRIITKLKYKDFK